MKICRSCRRYERWHWVFLLQLCPSWQNCSHMFLVFGTASQNSRCSKYQKRITFRGTWNMDPISRSLWTPGPHNMSMKQAFGGVQEDFPLGSGYLGDGFLRQFNLWLKFETSMYVLFSVCSLTSCSYSWPTILLTNWAAHPSTFFRSNMIPH